MYLLARELTGDARAAWVAGACYGFALLRLPQLTHLQVLSSQWMPFALYGLRRYFTTLRADPLGWAAVALVLQNLSCGYYLVFFAPVVVLYCLYEIADRGLWSRWRMWVGARHGGGRGGAGDVAVREAVPLAPRAAASSRGRSGRSSNFPRTRSRR